MCMLQYRLRQDLSAEVAGITSVNQAESVCIAIRTYKNRERKRSRGTWSDDRREIKFLGSVSI